MTDGIGKALYKLYMDAYLKRSEEGDPNVTRVSDCVTAGLLAVRSAAIEESANACLNANEPNAPGALDLAAKRIRALGRSA